MTASILARSQRSRRPKSGSAFTFHPNITFEPTHIYEICGNARRSFAIMLAGQSQGTILWISPAWQTDRLNPDGMRHLADPSRFLFVSPRHPGDLLWAMEEALRSGACPLVIADLPKPIALTPTRRLLLAAETGEKEGNHRPLGLILTPDNGGTRGIESRWQCESAHGQSENTWKLSRLYARSAPPASWYMSKGRKGLTLREESQTENG